MTGPVDLVVEEPRWLEGLPDLGEIADTATRAALSEAGADPDHCEIALLACNDARIAQLNARFRGREQPTNVLSWPAFSLAADRPGLPPKPLPQAQDDGPLALGDVALAFQTVTRQAEEQGVGLKSHVIHLILHGTLHLLGYDHETEADAALMEGMETRLLARLGFPDPYVFVEADAARPASDR